MLHHQSLFEMSQLEPLWWSSLFSSHPRGSNQTHTYRIHKKTGKHISACIIKFLDHPFLYQSSSVSWPNIRGLWLPQALAHARCRRQTSGRTKLNEACGFPPKFSQWVFTTVTAGVNWGPFHQLVEFHESWWISTFNLGWSRGRHEVKTPNALFWKWRFFWTQHSNPSMFSQPFPKQKNAQQIGKNKERELAVISMPVELPKLTKPWVVHWDTRTLQRHAGQSANLSRLAKKLLASTISSCCNAKGSSSVANSRPQMKVT